jgi:hypothetical protein
MSNWTPPDTWLVLLEKGESASTHIDPADETAIDVAVSRYLETKRDEILHLTLSEGGPYRVLASRISSWWINTPEHSRRNLLRTEKSKEDEKERRAALGLPWKEDDV